jgi:nitronate monooxygenase
VSLQGAGQYKRQALRHHQEFTMQTRLTQSFAIQHPILSAPMAFISGGKLAAAVSAAGGLGFIGGGYCGTLGGDLDFAAEVAQARPQKFGIGFITWALEQNPSLLDDMLASSPYAVFLSFGDPQLFAEKIKQSGAKLICQVQTIRHVDQAIDAGADAIVAQGAEAGGHGGSRSTSSFVPEVADHLALHSPATLLLAAGGIADGRGLAAALMLGADGVVVGTRFWASAEALTPARASELALQAGGDDTVRNKTLDALRGVAWPAEFSFRVLKNQLTAQWAGRESEARAAFGSLAEVYAQARLRNDLDTVAVVVGECIGLINERPSAASLVAAIVSQAESLLGRGAGLDFT